MMEDAGEDVLRHKPSMVVSFFKRIGQVSRIFWPLTAVDITFLFIILDISINVRQIDPLHNRQMDIHSSFNHCLYGQSVASTGLYVVTSLWANICCMQGWYIVTYALAIYHLNLLLAFLTPKIDPAMAEYEREDDEEGMALPTSQNEEFRPFIRRLPEFKFWYSATKATAIAFFCTFFELFNIPVFWPILVMYFITLFCITMKRQIKVRLTSI